MGATYPTPAPTQGEARICGHRSSAKNRGKRVVHNLAGSGPAASAAGYGPGMAATRPSTDERHELGRLGEALAATLLESAGLLVVARNWRCR